ncbi:MAG: hypothetical protein IKM61_00080 [Eubacteriaceae bacterium]|nr:hypothetical protein [Eubacteriaceae bacterium]
MNKKIFNSIFSISLTIVLVSLLLFAEVFHAHSTAEIDKQLKYEATIIRIGLEKFGTDFFEQLVDTPIIYANITYIDEYGNVLFSTSESHDFKERFYMSKDVQRALQTGEGYTSKRGDSVCESIRYFSIFIPEYNILRISAPYPSLLGILKNNSVYLIFISGLLAALTFIVSKDKARKITVPINNINLSKPTIPDGYDEISPLVERINEQNDKIKKQIEEIKYRQEQFDIIADSMQEGIIIVNADMSILSINKSARIIFNTCEGNVSRIKNAYDFPEVVLNNIKKSLSGEVYNDIIKINNIYYEIISCPVYKDDGTVAGIATIMLNVMQRIENERIRREFTSNVSHELKTPLTHIYSIAEMITNNVIKTEDIPHFVEIIQNESNRMIRLIKNIMHLSRLDEGQVKNDRIPVDLFGVADNVVRRYSALASERNISIKLNGDSIIISGVLSFIEEIIANIIENAIKYNKDNGDIIVDISSDEENACIKVSDTGIGIPDTETKRIFERFYRVDKSHSRIVSGNGLGLSIVKHAVEFHHGTINIDSTYGKGTTITVTLPIK